MDEVFIKEEHHKGEICIYKRELICQEDLCSGCAIPITCVSCGLTDNNKVHIIDYQHEKYPYCDDELECLNRMTKLKGGE